MIGRMMICLCGSNLAFIGNRYRAAETANKETSRQLLCVSPTAVCIEDARVHRGSSQPGQSLTLLLARHGTQPYRRGKGSGNRRCLDACSIVISVMGPHPPVPTYQVVLFDRCEWFDRSVGHHVVDSDVCESRLWICSPGSIML